MKAKELIKLIQDNQLEDYEVYAGGETGGTCWEIDNVRTAHVDEKEDGYYHGMHHIKDYDVKINAIII